MTSLTFTAPDANSWEFDASHQSHPFPRLFHGALEEGYRDGFADGFADVGAMLECLEARILNGWTYMTARPVGAPPGAGGPPPWLVFKLLLLLHPALRRRTRDASTVWERRPWVPVITRWHGEQGPWWTERLRSRQAIAPDTLDDAALIARIRLGVADARDLYFDHFKLASRCVAPIGDLLVAAGERGIPVSTVFAGLAGASTETSRPRELVRAIAQGVREARLPLDGEPSAVLARLRAHERTSGPLERYLDAYGWRIADKDDFLGAVLHEQPSTVVATIRTAAEREPPAPADPVARFLEPLDASARADLAPRLEQARMASSTREHTCSLLLWLQGLVRRDVLALGERWVSSGRAPSRGAPFHLAPAELDPAPSHAELVAREAEFVAWGAATPPTHLNAPSDPPPLEWLPPAQQRLTRAVVAFVERFQAAPDLAGDEPLTGVGASPGVVEGRAHLLDRGLDGLAVGDILVASSTSPALNSVLPSVGGLVTAHGGLVSHAAIVSRELGFPGVVGCVDALSRIPHGSWIRVDGTTGRVVVLAEVAPERERRIVDADPGGAVEATVPDGPGAWCPLDAALDSGRFGGKAAQLAHAVGAGHPVPAGVALDTVLVQGIAAGSPGHLKALQDALIGLRGPLAVRSSAPDEDGRSASFAGLHHTALGVAPEDVGVAVGAVWQSASGPGARAYRARLGLDGSAEMAVVVQEMVDAACAGVRFGRDPVTGEDVRVVEAAPGLGVAVVDGRVRPDRVRLSADGRLLHEEVGDKPVQVVLRRDGVHEEPVPPESVGASSLDPSTLAAVHALGEACDALFRAPQDVEWARAGDRVWLLQSRPITTGVADA